MSLLAVNYHYFRNNKPVSGIYPLTLGEFVLQLDKLSKEYDFIEQSEVVGLMQEGITGRPKCLLTFDDGLKEQMEVFRILRQKGIPGVFYVTTDAIQYGTVVDVHKLHYIRSALTDEDVMGALLQQVDLPESIFDQAILQRQYRYDTPLAQKLKYSLNFILSDAERRSFVDKLFSELVGCEYRFSKGLYMDIEDLKSLNSIGCLGTHASSHRPLGQLSEQEAIADIEKSIQFIGNSVGAKPYSISYPYGGDTAIPKVDDATLERLGLKFGLTMCRGINHIDQLEASMYGLKRVDTNDAVGGKNYNSEYFK